VWHLFTDERGRQAVEVAERYADGQATFDELRSAYAAVERITANPVIIWHKMESAG
jgi:hypothetical protein